MGKSPQGRKKYRRRRKFIRRDLQLKLIFGALFVALLVLVFNFQIPFIGLWIAESSTTVVHGASVDLLKRLLIYSFLVSFALTLPLSLWMGIVFSFHFCGPIYRIKKHFCDLTKGRWDEVCRLRRKDDLHDVKDAINEFGELVCGRLRSSYSLFEDVQAVLDGHTESEGAVSPEELRQRVQSEMAAIERRLGVTHRKEEPTARNTAEPEETSDAGASNSQSEALRSTDGDTSQPDEGETGDRDSEGETESGPGTDKQAEPVS